MKRIKKSDKLALKTETIRSLDTVRVLDDQQLANAQGGSVGPTSSRPGCGQGVV